MGKNALIRICARCRRVHIRQGGCPVCGFATYDSVWAVGWWRTIIGLITRRHSSIKEM
jgi:RNA polymerase subunit RPABC4/transcription elongation factor Spt4